MVGVLRFKNSETGEWQEINAIKGEPGKDYVLTEADKEEIAQSVGTDNFYTKSEIDEKLENFEGGGGFEPDNNSIVLTEEETLAVNPEWINGKLPRYGRGLAYDGSVVRMNSDGTIGYDDNGRAVVNQNNIFIKGGSNWVLSEHIDPTPLNNEFNLIEVETNMDDWFAHLQNRQVVQVRLRTEEMGFGGGVKANIERGIEVRGTVYDYYINLSGVLGPSQIEQLGIIAMAVGYNSGIVSFIVERNPAVELDDIVRVELGDEVRVNSLAHYWIGRDRQWKITNSGNIEINEDYINELIDMKLADMPVGDIPSGEEVEF